jgi:hypothetical protein
MFTHVAGPSVAGVHADHAGSLEADSPFAAAVSIRGDGNLDALQSSREVATTCQNMQKGEFAACIVPWLGGGFLAASWSKPCPLEQIL